MVFKVVDNLVYMSISRLYSNVSGDCNGSFVFFVSNASAEVIANVALSRLKPLKVQVKAPSHPILPRVWLMAFLRFMHQKQKGSLDL